jgi:hypothetical protein
MMKAIAHKGIASLRWNTSAISYLLLLTGARLERRHN